MGDDETQRWIKDHLMQQATHTATILTKLDAGESRMCSMQGTLDEVVECTREFPALKMTVEELEAERKKNVREKFATLEMKVQKQESEAAEKKKVWNARFWELGIKFATPVLIAGYVIYNIIKDKMS